MAQVSFDSIDLSDYGVEVLSADKDSIQLEIGTVQVYNKAYTWKGQIRPLLISLDVLVSTNSTYSDIDELLSTIRSVLDEEEPCKLSLSTLTDRYWLAHFQALLGSRVSPTQWRGTIDFLCPDSRAYDETETVSNHNINSDPDTVVETPGGNAVIEPVYLFTAGEVLGAITLKIKNVSADQELEVGVTLTTNDELEIDVATWMVRKNGTAAMSDVSGKFPGLAPGANAIRVTNGSTTGTLKITYRNRWA